MNVYINNETVVFNIMKIKVIQFIYMYRVRFINNTTAYTAWIIL